jgi:two-component system, LytTR family, response regulator
MTFIMKNEKQRTADHKLLRGALYFHSTSGLTHVIMKKGRKEVLNLPLTRIESMLPENTFCRVHRSYLVNANAISAIRYFRTQLLAFVEGHRVPVSRRHGRNLLDSLNTL